MDFYAGLGRLEHVLGRGRVVTSLKAIYVKPSISFVHFVPVRTCGR